MVARMEQLQQDLQSSDDTADLETQHVPTQQGQRKKVAVIATIALIGLVALGVASMRRQHITEGRPEDSTVLALCGPKCGEWKPEWSAKCKWNACAGCGSCSSLEPDPEEPKSDAEVCEGNCAKNKPYTCQSDMAKCSDTKFTDEGPYDWTISTTTPTAYDPEAKCSDPKYWIEVDLGKKMAFNRIDFLRPNRPGPGWCGTKIEIDGKTIYENLDYVFTPGKAKSEGKNALDAVTVLNPDGEDWTGEKIKVYSGGSYKKNKPHASVHFAGLEVYQV